MKKMVAMVLCCIILFSSFSINAMAAGVSSDFLSQCSSSYKNGAYYKKLTEVIFTSNSGVNLAAVAKSQLGYHEGKNSEDLSGNSKGSSNYTEYNRWWFNNKNNHQYWCNLFVGWCFAAAGISTKIAPKNSFYLDKWRNCGAEVYSWKDYSEKAYTPQPGDIVIYGDTTTNNKNGSKLGNSCKHVGIITDYKNGTFYTVEGNWSEKVSSRNYKPDAKTGYIKSDGSYIHAIIQPSYNQYLSLCKKRLQTSISVLVSQGPKEKRRVSTLPCDPDTVDYGGKYGSQYVTSEIPIGTKLEVDQIVENHAAGHYWYHVKIPADYNTGTATYGWFYSNYCNGSPSKIIFNNKIEYNGILLNNAETFSDPKNPIIKDWWLKGTLTTPSSSKIITKVEGWVTDVSGNKIDLKAQKQPVKEGNFASFNLEEIDGDDKLPLKQKLPNNKAYVMRVKVTVKTPYVNANNVLVENGSNVVTEYSLSTVFTKGKAETAQYTSVEIPGFKQGIYKLNADYNALNGLEITASTKKYSKNEYVKIIGKYTLTKTSNGKTSIWCKTEDGKWIEFDKLTKVQDFIGGYELYAEIAVSVKVKDLFGVDLHFEPYQDAAKAPVPNNHKSYNTVLNVVGVYKNNANHYWLKLDNGYFINPEYVTLNDVIKKPVLSEANAPTGRYTKGTTFKFYGVLSGDTVISKVTGGIYYDGGSNHGKTVSVSGASSFEQHVTNVKSISISTINDKLDFKKLPEGNYYYQLKWEYYTYRNVKDCSVCPVVKDTGSTNKAFFSIDTNTSSHIAVSGVILDTDELSIYVGQIRSISASVMPATATDKKIVWESSNPECVSVENGKLTAKSYGFSTIRAISSDDKTKYAECYVDVRDFTEDVEISPHSEPHELVPGEQFWLGCKIWPGGSDGENIIWKSSDPSVVTINQEGCVTAVSGGKAVISATDACGVTGYYDVTVLSYITNLTLSYPEVLDVGESSYAEVFYSPAYVSDPSLIWTSSNENVISVAEGFIEAKAKGTATIRVTAEDRGIVYAEKTITVVQPVVSITLSTPDKIFVGETKTIGIAVSPDSANNKNVSVSISDPTIATWSAAEGLRCIAPGTVTVTVSALDGSGINTKRTIVCVTPVMNIELYGNNEISEGGTSQISTTILPSDANNKALSWHSSDPSVATVNEHGTITGIRHGAAVITASALDGSGVTAQFTVTVSSKNITVNVSGDGSIKTGETKNFNATVTSESVLGSYDVIWSSMNSNVASVDAQGHVTGIGNGSTIIRATSVEDPRFFGEMGVTITTSVNSINIAEAGLIFAGDETSLLVSILPESASNKSVSWSSSDADIASVDERGIVTAWTEGIVTISADANDGSGMTGSIILDIKPYPELYLNCMDNLEPGEVTEASVETVSGEDYGFAYNWSSSDISVATVSSDGEITALAEGTTIITAAVIGRAEFTTNYTITVRQRLQQIIIDVPDSIMVGDSVKLNATLVPANASGVNIEWEVVDEKRIASIDDYGTLTAMLSGKVTVIAHAIDEFYGDIMQSEPEEIEIYRLISDLSVDNNPVAYIGQNDRINVIVLPTDATNKAVTWTSSNENIVWVETVGESYIAHYVGVGVATITATAVDGSGVSAYGYVDVQKFIELDRNEASATVYAGGAVGSTVSTISLKGESINKIVSRKGKISWEIEHVSGPEAVKLGLEGRIGNYGAYSLSESVSVKLLGTAGTGTDVYRVKCVSGGDSASCLLTVNTVSTALPSSITAATTQYTLTVGQSTSINLTPVATPSGSLPADIATRLERTGAFNLYSELAVDDNNTYTVRFHKAGMYKLNVIFYGANYSYTSEVTFTVTNTSGYVPPEVEDIRFDTSTKLLRPGEAYQATYTITPSYAEPGLLWSCSDTGVATVDGNGMITAVAEGTAFVTVTAGNNISATCCVMVIDGLLSIDWNAYNVIDIYSDGRVGNEIKTIYLANGVSAQLEEAPTWSLERINGRNLTLRCEPVTALDKNGETIYGCALILKSVSSSGETVYRLRCSYGADSTSTQIIVHAEETSESIPSTVRWQNNVFTGRVNALISIVPELECLPEGSSLPGGTVVSITADKYWNAALIDSNYSLSDKLLTVAFNEPGVYSAVVNYKLANITYTVPISVRIQDENGFVPVRLEKLTLSEEKLYLSIGETKALNAYMKPGDATNKNVTWTSSNTSVVTVDQSGNITAVSNGSARILCTPADTNCSFAYCDVTVEELFTLNMYLQMDLQYVGGELGKDAADFRLSDGTAARLEANNLDAEWNIEKLSGSSSDVSLTVNDDGIASAIVTALYAEGNDVYRVTCTAGQYTDSREFTLGVLSVDGVLPSGITLAQTEFSVEPGEEITIDFTPVCEPASSALPNTLRASYIGLGRFYDALNEDYVMGVLTARTDSVKLCFDIPGTYVLARYYNYCNIKYVARAVIHVGSGELELLVCDNPEPVAYVGGKPFVAATCVIADVSVAELANSIVWSAERLSGDCMNVALKAGREYASLYVASANAEGNETWRITCTVDGIESSTEITLYSVMAKAGLPEEATLLQTDFEGVAGESISIPLSVTCVPENSSLPDKSDSAWIFNVGTGYGNTIYYEVRNSMLTVCFEEEGYYSGLLCYESGSVSYNFELRFAISSEEYILSKPSNMAIALSDTTITVYPEGKTSVAIAAAHLYDPTGSYGVSAVSAYAQFAGAAWSIQTSDGASCELYLEHTSAGRAEIMLGQMSTTGDTAYTLTCEVDGKTYTAGGTVHVALSDEVRPQATLDKQYYSVMTGTSIVIDVSLYERENHIELCSGRNVDWRDAVSHNSIAYDYSAAGDAIAVFNQPGLHTTIVSARISNLAFEQQLLIYSYSYEQIMHLPAATRTIGTNAFSSVGTNVIDLRGTQVETIGSRAFSGCDKLVKVYIPASVTYIADDAFDDCLFVKVYCTRGSYAYTWATQNNIETITVSE